MIEEAEKMDRALVGLRETLASTHVVSQTQDGTLDARSDWKIRDDRTFSIQYFSPDSGPQQNLLKGDGKRRAELAFGRWTDLPPFGGSSKAQKPELDGLAVTVVRRMAAPFRTGEPFWGPLVKALARGEDGFSLKMESKTFDAHGQARKIFRYVAQRTKPIPASLEIVVDAQRSVPLTVRAVESRPDGGEDRVMWTAKWSFQGGRHDDRDFVVPTRP
jgi:hypothetical protein